MDVAIERRAPKIRCHKCGSSSVRAVCHHCWRPGCGRHVVRFPAWAEWLFGVEGSGPGLKNVRGWHCGDCTHAPAGVWLGAGVSGLALTVLGLLAMSVSIVAGVFPVAIGGLMALAVYIRIRHRSAQARASLPVALNPRVSEVQASERLSTKITLSDQGNYLTQLNPIKGRLRAQLTFGDSDRERVKGHLRKHRLAVDQKVQYSAGCLVPQGPAGIKELSVNRIVKVTGDDAAGTLGIDQDDSPVLRRYDVTLDYTLLTAPDIKASPFWVTPSIAPGSEKHTLEIDIQWTEFGPDDGDPLVLDMIDLLRIRVPVSWGLVQEISRGAATVSAPSEPDSSEWSRTIEWKQLSPDRAERQARQFTIVVRFENPILARNYVSGRLEATMKGSLSGLSGIRMYNALGASRAFSGTPRVRTRVDADFTLSLSSVRYQATRVFPDREAEDMDRARFSDDFDIIPDDETIISLTNALAENQFYIKRVTENPPRSGGRAEVLHRYWHIAGRSYEGVHPVDFHIVVTGEEVHRGDVRAESGNTKIRISVSGAYTSDEMRARVDNTWIRLREISSEAVMKSRRSTGHGSNMGAE